MEDQQETEAQDHVILASGKGIRLLAIADMIASHDLIVRLIPECSQIISRPLGPGEAEYFTRILPEIVR